MKWDRVAIKGRKEEEGTSNLLICMAGLDHVAIRKLLRLGSLTSNFTRYRHLSTLGTRFHDESEHTVASTADSQAAKELVLQGLSLGLRAEASCGNAFSEDLNSALSKVKSAYSTEINTR